MFTSYNLPNCMLACSLAQMEMPFFCAEDIVISSNMSIQFNLEKAVKVFASASRMQCSVFVQVYFTRCVLQIV